MKRIIIYSTKYGCTEKAAKLLQSKLTDLSRAASGETAKVVTLNIAKEKAPDLSQYDTVILGGSIYVGKILKPIFNYLQQNAEVLKKKRLALFICAGEQDPAALGKLMNTAFPEELSKQAVVKEGFGGELHLDRVGFVTWLMLRIVMGVKADYSRLSEEKIRKFAEGVLNVQV